MAPIRVALDIDGTLVEHGPFFSALSRCPGLEIHIVTGRSPEDRTVTLGELESLGIRHAGLHFADQWEDKGRLCREIGADILFEDQDEYIRWVPEGTLVFKARNGGNFDFDARTWLT